MYWLALLAASVLAQTPPPYADPMHARELLASERLLDKAWGAEFAGAKQLNGLNGLLIDQLRAAAGFRNATRDAEEYARVQALLDA